MARPLGGSALVTDYLRGVDPAASFYAGSPRAISSYEARVQQVDQRFDAADRRALASFVRPAGTGARAALERVVSGDALVVTTGQQPSLLSGPLYTVYKLISAIRLARELTERLGRPVEPVFWIASDDHDWAEANHAYVLDPANNLQRIEVERDEAEPQMSLARIRPGAAVERAMDRLGEALPESDFSSDVLRLARDAYLPGRTMSAAFDAFVTGLCGRFGYLVVDAGDPALKVRASDVLEAELEASAEHEAVLARNSGLLQAAGYEPQVPILERAANVFFEDDAGRDRLVRDSGGWVLRRSGRRFGHGELLSRLRSEPEHFSPNVLLRPVVESALLPTLAYVGGPGELAYLAQSGQLFGAHGLEPPLAVPRHGAVLVEAKVAKVLSKFDLEPSDLETPVQEIAGRVARDELPADVALALADVRSSLEGGYERLMDAAALVDPTLAGPLRAALSESRSVVSGVEKRILKHWKQRNAVALDQLDKAAANLFPDGRPQERVLNVCSYLARYGSELLDALVDSFDPDLESAGRSEAGVAAGPAAGRLPQKGDGA